MKSVYLDFLKKILFYSIGIEVIVIIINYFLPANFHTPVAPFLVPFYFSLTLIFHYLQLKAVNKSFANFTTNYMLLTFIKLVVLLLFLLLYIYFHKKEAIPFIVWYFLLYLFYTFFEAFALKNINTDKNKE